MIEKFFARVGRNVFVWEIDVSFDVGEDQHEAVAKCVDAGAERAGELLVGGAEGEFGAGMNQVDNGFGLRKVDAAVEKGAAGGLAPVGGAGGAGGGGGGGGKGGGGSAAG